MGPYEINGKGLCYPYDNVQQRATLASSSERPTGSIGLNDMPNCISLRPKLGMSTNSHADNVVISIQRYLPERGTPSHHRHTTVF